MEPPVFSWLMALPAIKKAVAADVNAGLRTLRDTLRVQPLQGFELELTGRLLRDVPVMDLTELPTYRLAVLASFTSEPVANAARVALLREGYVADVYEAPFGSYRQAILSPESDLYAFRPDAVVIAASAADSTHRPRTPMPDQEVEEALDREIEQWRALWDLIASRLNAPVLQHLCEVPEEEFLGIAERRAAWTPSRFMQSLNERLVAVAPSFVKWIDVDRLAARVGRQNWHDVRLYHHGKMGFNPRFLPDYSVLFSAAWRSAAGKTRKALILDLDNTLWGGVLGDEGIDGVRLGPDSAEGEAYQAFCRYVKGLGQRGVILGICSKNELATIVDMFEHHPHMPLTLDEFAVVACNWDDKASNLLKLVHDLNIDASSVVFVDDNPAECEWIRQSIPEIRTIQLDGDPAQFVRTLDHQHLFDSQALSREDLTRSESYKARAQSTAALAQAIDLDAHLASLEMKALVVTAGPAELPRLAQMEMKTNQFNLTTRRLTLEQLGAMSASPDAQILAISLTDRFTNHGLVSYVASRVVADTLVITDWLMSCRVFSRTLEHLVFNRLADDAAAKGLRAIELCFNPTAKNKLMEPLFERLGFLCAGTAPNGPWRYAISPDREPLPCFITDSFISR